MSEAKKRPSGAFSARLHRRGITIDATCPVPSIVPLPRKRLTFSATGSVSPLSVSRCGNTASESLLLRQKEHRPTGWCSFCIQRFEQGMSEAKKRPSGAFSARLHRRGITIDATCPVPSIVPLPRKRLTFSATGSVSPLSVSRCGNTASESLLLRQIKPLSFDGGFIFYSALSANWAFLPLLPQHLSCGEDGVANALRAGTEDLAGLHAL